MPSFRCGAGPITRRCLLVVALILPALGAAASAATPGAVDLEQMTTEDVKQAVAHGVTTILIPIGGTEQNGPAMALGKHNERARRLAERIAGELGNTLVAPVMAYVPEGNIDPPSEHMHFAGTLSIPVATFEELLAGTAKSLRQHGFRTIVFLGDHGGYQKPMAEVAAHLTRDWAGGGVRVIALHEYYEASSRGFDDILRKRGFSEAQIGTHAGLADTSLTLAIAPELVRIDELDHAVQGRTPGVTGDARGATAKLGMLGINLIVARSVAAIRSAQARP